MRQVLTISQLLFVPELKLIEFEYITLSRQVLSMAHRGRSPMDTETRPGSAQARMPGVRWHAITRSASGTGVPTYSLCVNTEALVD